MLGPLNEALSVGGFAQRLGRDDTDMDAGHLIDAIAKARQTGQTAPDRLFAQLPFRTQTGAKPHGLLQVVHPVVSPITQSAQFQAEAVGADIDRGKAMRMGRRKHGANCPREEGVDV